MGREQELPMSMTSEAKSQLSKTIRALRTQLLADLQSSGESTYQFAVNISKAKLTAADQARRQRIEDWVAEQVRTQAGRKNGRTRDDFLRDLEKQAAYTLLNRMVILLLMESMGLRKQKPVAVGRRSIDEDLSATEQGRSSVVGVSLRWW